MTHGDLNSSSSGTGAVMPEKRIFAKSGHVCMMCGFKATTKNKYRELQDHLVRQHFQDRIKSALPTRRPFLCPDHSCNVEGKDWQALMRHYTGKHGVLEAYIKEFMASQMEHKENLHLGRPVSPLPPTNKIGCRRKRYKRNSSGDQQDNPMAAEDRTEDTPPIISSTTTTSLSTSYEPNNHSEPATLCSTSTCEYITQDELITTTSGLNSSPVHHTSLTDEEGNTILQLDDSEPAPIPPTHLALVLKKRKVGKDGLEEGEPEETYAFVDLKYFQPLSANQYLMKSQVIDPNLLALHQSTNDFNELQAQDSTNFQSGSTPMAPPPPLISNGANGGGCYFLESGVQSPVSTGNVAAAVVDNQAAEAYFESFPPISQHHNSSSSSSTSVVSNFAVSSSNWNDSTTVVDSTAFRECYDQVVPNPHHSPHIPNCATEVEVSSNDNQCNSSPAVVMQVPITNSSSVATVSVMTPEAANHSPKGLNRGCSKVVVETVKSIPMDQASAGTSYELISHEGLNGMKEIDFTMF